MPYLLTLDDLTSITDLDIAFGSTRLLPPEDEIPADFKRGNQYTKLAEALFFGRPIPEGEVRFHPGFEDAQKHLVRCVRAHLASFEPDHDRSTDIRGNKRNSRSIREA